MEKKPKKKTPKQLKKIAWDLYSKVTRISSSDQYGFCNCYTCGDHRHYKAMQAGHGVAGRGNYVLFNDEVVRVQCPRCNLKQPYGLDGNYQVFIPKLIKEIGQERYEEIERKSHEVCKLPKGFYDDKIIELKELLAKLPD